MRKRRKKKQGKYAKNAVEPEREASFIDLVAHTHTHTSQPRCAHDNEARLLQPTTMTRKGERMHAQRENNPATKSHIRGTIACNILAGKPQRSTVYIQISSIMQTTAPSAHSTRHQSRSQSRSITNRHDYAINRDIRESHKHKHTHIIRTRQARQPRLYHLRRAARARSTLHGGKVAVVSAEDAHIYKHT